jgi:hypothetical protein
MADKDATEVIGPALETVKRLCRQGDISATVRTTRPM